MASPNGWAGAYHCALEKDKDQILLGRLPDVLSDMRSPYAMKVWSRIQSWPPTQQSELFLKHSLVDQRADAAIKSWPLDVQLNFLTNGGQVTDMIQFVSAWPHKFQQAYYDKHPPQYEAAVDKAVLEDERLFRLDKNAQHRPEVLATRAFFMTGYTVPDFAPAICGNAPAGIALAIGFGVYTTFHGVHAHMKPAWFAPIMRAVIARYTQEIIE